MANFTKTAQNVLGTIGAGASVLNALGFGSTLRTPKPSQETFNNVRGQIYQDIKKWGIQKANLGYVSFASPTTLSSTSYSKEIVLLAQNRANQFPIPAVSMATTELRRYGVGPFEKKPYLPTFTDVTIDFIGDSEGNIHKFFYLWMNSICNFFELPAANASQDFFQGVAASKSPFALEFKDNYRTRISLLTFNENQEKLTNIYLENAFPVSIGEIQYDWSNESQLVRFPVTFSFTHWTYDITDPNFGFSVPQVKRSDFNLNLVYNFLIQLYPAAQAVELATKRPRQIQDVVRIVNGGKSGLSPITRYF